MRFDEKKHNILENIWAEHEGMDGKHINPELVAYPAPGDMIHSLAYPSIQLIYTEACTWQLIASKPYRFVPKEVLVGKWRPFYNKMDE